MNENRQRSTFRWIARAAALALAAGVLATPALAQTGGGYDLTWNTFDGGGATFSAGGGYELGATIGQPDAAQSLTGGAYRLSGGFWYAPSFLAYVPATRRGAGSDW